LRAQRSNLFHPSRCPHLEGALVIASAAKQSQGGGASWLQWPVGSGGPPGIRPMERTQQVCLAAAGLVTWSPARAGTAG